MSKGPWQSVLDPLDVSRRRLVGAAAVALDAFRAHGAAAQTAASVEAGRHDAGATDPGLENRPLAAISPDSINPPATDHGSAPNYFWHSFSLAHRRIREGGWTRQVNVEDFPISKEIAGVNMKLNAGGVRELHWHAADEWSLMLTGSCRLTALDFDGRPYVQDVSAGDLWYFPTGVPHSIQGLGPEGCEFLLVFDDGTFSEDNTTLISDWAIHTPKDVLASRTSCVRLAFKKAPKLFGNAGMAASVIIEECGCAPFYSLLRSLLTTCRPVRVRLASFDRRVPKRPLGAPSASSRTIWEERYELEIAAPRVGNCRRLVAGGSCGLCGGRRIAPWRHYAAFVERAGSRRQVQKTWTLGHWFFLAWRRQHLDHPEHPGGQIRRQPRSEHQRVALRGSELATRQASRRH
jgi:oxalate decarboxylase/phosphoglucose isomerase-like protein (cupin superfamily)